MSFDINKAFVQRYTNVVQLLLQQKGSKLREYVMTAQQTGKGAKAVEQIGPVTAQKRMVRHSDTPIIGTPHAARWVYPNDWEWGDLIDDQDKLRILASFDSPYAQNGAMALGRAMDDEILAAAFATSAVGENGTDTEAFTGQTVSTAGGLTVAKLREAKLKLMNAEVDVDNDPLVVAMKPKQHDNLLADALTVSLDYNDTPVLVDGRIRSFMGFNFVTTTRVLASGATDRVLAFAKSGIHLSIWNDITTRIAERADKAFSTQVYVKATFGATRLELGKVVEIQCT